MLGLKVENHLDQIMHKVPGTINNNYMYCLVNLTSIVPVYSSLIQAHLPPLSLQQNVLYPSKMGLYPVHLHRLPNNQK